MGRTVTRRRQQADYGVQQLVDSKPVESRGRHDGDKGPFRHSHLDARENFLLRQFLTLEVLVRQLLVGLGRGLDDSLTGLFGLIGEVFGNVRLRVEQVDDPAEVGLGAYRKLNGHALATERLDKGLHDSVEVGVLPVELAHDDQLGQVFGHLPHLDRADFDARRGRDEDEGGICSAEGRHDLAAIVGIAGAVNQVDLEVLVYDRKDGRLNAILALVLFRLVVGSSRLVLDPAQSGRRLGREKRCFGENGLASTAVG